MANYMSETAPPNAFIVISFLNVSRASLRFEKDRSNIDSFRGFIEKFSLFSSRSETLSTQSTPKPTAIYPGDRVVVGRACVVYLKSQYNVNRGN